MDVYLQALQSDPVLEQAQAQSRIGQAAVGTSRAYLLPQLHGSVSYTQHHGIQSGSQVYGTSAGPIRISASGHYRERSRTDSIALSQVLFDAGKYEQWQAARSGALAAATQYTVARQKLILRVAQAYFGILADEAQLEYARSNADLLKKQLERLRKKRDAGFASTTSVSDAEAAYDSALATVINSRNTVHNDRQALANITGRKPRALEDLVDDLPLDLPQPPDGRSWVDIALANNPSLSSQRKLVKAAQHQINASRDDRLPTLNATVSYSHNPSWRGPSVVNAGGLPADLQQVLHANSRTTDTMVGLVLNVPLFAGGGIHAQVKQAIAQRDHARSTLEAHQRNIISDTRNAFQAIRAGILSVKVNKQAVASARTALDLTRKDYDIGTHTIVDLLIAQKNYFAALNTYSRARYALVLNRLNLKFATGTLSVKDLEAVNSLLLDKNG